MNDMTFTQASALLTEIASQAQGTKAIAPVNTASFVALAGTTLKLGYDVVSNSISQVLSRTIFSVRPYNRKLKGMKADSIRFGNHVRKITILDGAVEDDDRQSLTDGQSIDQQVVNKPKALQTNFYGIDVYQRHVTIYRDQLDVAFSSAEEFGRFISMVYQNISDQIEKVHEETARATLSNMIGAKVLADNTNVYYLFDEYYAETGVSLTSATYKDPQYYENFCKWMFGFINTISDKMEERSVLFHQNITGKNIMRHTPKSLQKMYMFAPEMNQIDSRLFSSIFGPQFLKLVDFEKVNYWQSIKSPKQIQVKPSYMDIATGAVVESEDSVTVDNILGVLFDQEACGFTTINTWSAAAPFNARGGYTNMFWHFSERPWNDLTENFCVFVLDKAPSYDLTVTKGTHTTITLKLNGETLASTTKSDAFKMGDRLEVSATAANGYHLTTFTVNGEDVTGSTVIQVTDDVTIVTAAEADT